jgi:hypothetical protein
MEEPIVEPFNPVRAMDANAIYASDPQSPTRRAIFREVYGAAYPEEVAPNSFITMPQGNLCEAACFSWQG